MDKFSYRFTSMFRPEKGVYIDCFINNIYINYLILRRTSNGISESKKRAGMVKGVAKWCIW